MTQFAPEEDDYLWSIYERVEREGIRDQWLEHLHRQS
jgi:hypothetical protein